MATNRSRTKKGKTVVEIDIMRTDPATLLKIAEEEGLEISGIYPIPDGSGVTFGHPMQDCEHSGEGLPELGERAEIGQWRVEFSMRASCDREGNTYLEVAKTGGGSFHRFEFSGLDFYDAQRAIGKFNNEFELFLIYYGLSPLFLAHYRRLHSKKQDRLDALKRLNEHFADKFNSILNPKRERLVETRELLEGSVRLKTFEPILGGREPKSIENVEAEKSEFISQVFEALKRIETEGGKQTQLDVGVIIFENRDSEDVQSLMKNRCRRYGFKWKDILSDYKRQKV
jgi:hypothetical protein